MTSLAGGVGAVDRGRRHQFSAHYSLHKILTGIIFHNKILTEITFYLSEPLNNDEIKDFLVYLSFINFVSHVNLREPLAILFVKIGH